MSTTPQEFAEPGKITFGIEIEFLIACCRHNEPDPDKDIEGLPPPLWIKEDSFTQHATVLQQVEEAIQAPFGPEPPKLAFVLKNIDDTHGGFLVPYSRFRVEDDCSVNSRTLRQDYMWYAMELKTPVAYEGSSAFEAISYAVSILKSKFRVSVNDSCGLHVHVGQRAELLSLDQLRRLTTILYAVEPLLYTLHRPERKNNTYCQPWLDPTRYNANRPRHAVELANRLYGEVFCGDYKGTVRRHGEYPLSSRNNSDADVRQAFGETRRPGHFEPFIPAPGKFKIMPAPAIVFTPWRGDVDEHDHSNGPSGRVRQIPRIRLPHHWPSRDVFGAANAFYRAESTCAIENMLCLGNKFFAINLMAYTCQHVDDDVHGLRTVEFRLADASLDGDWISTWARICVGIYKFALTCSPSRTMDILTSCQKAFEGDGSWDVIDMLDAMGLFAEAEAAEKRLLANKKDWGLEFVT